MPFINDMLDSFPKNPSAAEAVLEQGDEKAVAPPKVVTRFTYDVDKVMRFLRRRILGQPEALAAVEDMLRLVRADITDPQRPLFVSLFLGPTGVGKTEVVRCLAEAIHGNREGFCRVDMNTLSQEHYAASLTGAPPGYVGSKEGHTLLDKEAIEGSYRAPGIVLFDEVEKASSTVLQALLNVFDNGILTVASGQIEISFRNALIFMTSNIAAREIQQHAQEQSDSWWHRWFGVGGAPNEKKTEEIVRKGLEARFSPEFINRIDEIVTFNWIGGNVLHDIIQMEVENLNHRLQKHRCRLVLGPSMLHHLAAVGFDQKYGARSLKRALRKHLEVPLADYLLKRNWDPDAQESEISASWHDGKATFCEASEGGSLTRGVGDLRTAEPDI